METITIKLTGAPEWKGRGRKWRKGDEKEMSEHEARAHLALLNSPFTEVKGAKPSEDKMMHGTPENKSVSADDSGKPEREKQKPKNILKPKGWGKKK
jgi:hypothetical protein